MTPLPAAVYILNGLDAWVVKITQQIKALAMSSTLGAARWKENCHEHTYIHDTNLNVLDLHEVTLHSKYLHSEVLDAQLKLLTDSVDPEFG